MLLLGGEGRGPPYQTQDKLLTNIRFPHRHRPASEIGIDNCIVAVLRINNAENKACLLIPEFRGHKQETRLQDTETGRHGHSIEVFDPEGFNLFIFMINGNFV